jgi:hypothetical protein
VKFMKHFKGELAIQVWKPLVYSLTTDWMTGDRSPAEAKNSSSSLCVQTSSAAHPPSYTMGTGGPLSAVKRGRGVVERRQYSRTESLRRSYNN